MSARRRIAAPLVAALALSVTACAPALPETVVPGSAVTVGWPGAFTSGNPEAAPTPGNLDVAAMTRDGFGDLVDGEFVADSSFGAVSIVSDDPFTVRYDLREPAWSDGIPLDAADLLLGWAAASGFIDVTPPSVDGSATAGDALPTDAATQVPRIDEFARAIEVTYPTAIDDWQSRLTVAVPAHVVAASALGVEDPMEAKQALITAIEQDDTAALASIAEVWREGFTVGGKVSDGALISSGPFRVDEVAADAQGRSLTLVPNAAYRGAATPKVAKIELVPAGADPVAEVGAGVDVVQVAPLAANREAIDDLERRDFPVDTTHDGTVWTLLLRPGGVFSATPARAAFLRAIPSAALMERGAGAWASAYTASSALLAAPGGRAYDIIVEDAGFAAALTGADDSGREREAAGIAAGTPVCIVFDRADEFAAGAFSAARDAAAEAGWNVGDCGAEDLAGALEQGGWEAALVRVTIPQTADEIGAQWGTDGLASLVGLADPAVDALIGQLATTTDVYAERDVRAQIEAAIIRDAVALPIALNPVITVTDKSVAGIAARDGRGASLTAGAVQWEVIP